MLGTRGDNEFGRLCLLTDLFVYSYTGRLLLVIAVLCFDFTLPRLETFGYPIQQQN
jgi:hypothetical protein